MTDLGGQGDDGDAAAGREAFHGGGVAAKRIAVQHHMAMSQEAEPVGLLCHKSRTKKKKV